METHKPETYFGSKIDYYRVIFTGMIVLLHVRGKFAWFFDDCHVTKGWYIAVEFFFIVSGFLLAVDCDANDISAFQYIKKRVFQLWPMYICAFGIAFLYVNIVENRNTIAQMIFNLCGSIDEILMLQMAGLNKGSGSLYNAPTWYISAMLLAGYVLYWLLKSYRRVTEELILPASIIVIYSYFYRTAGFLDVWQITDGIWINQAFLRAFADMGLGVLAYQYFNRRIIEDAKICSGGC